ncbi:distal membrane-arm assembly complex protein 2 isoform X1 [Columba livia]|uniref:distal membrane-arm assembly complex protein 2 isoform X1 n=1 Tax=Columba livia TaxID=8932 RepID=UPI0031BB8B6F
MAALRAVLRCRGGPAPLPPPGQSRGAAGGLLQRLGRWFYEAEVAAEWGERLRRYRLRSRNAYCSSLRDTHGDDVAAAVFTLSCGGGVRFDGQQHWIRGRPREHPELLSFHEVPVVALDLSGSPITYDGLDNLVPLTRLQHLDLSRCPHLDDWALGRLHVFRDTLQELSVAWCPGVTERGLATLHHLRVCYSQGQHLIDPVSPPAARPKSELVPHVTNETPGQSSIVRLACQEMPDGEPAAFTLQEMRDKPEPRQLLPRGLLVPATRGSSKPAPSPSAKGNAGPHTGQRSSKGKFIRCCQFF